MKRMILFKTLLIACISWLSGSSALAQKYVETDISELQTGDVVVVVDKTSSYALPNDITNKAPIGTSVTLATDKSEIISTVSSNLEWEVNVTIVSGVRTYQFKIPGSEQYLYVKDTNEGVRIGTSADNSFIWDNANNKLKSSTLTRWIGVYVANPDWRCYNTGTATNIKNTVTAFYKLINTGKTPAGIEYETTEYTVWLGQDFNTPTLTNPNNLVPTYLIECTPVGAAEIDDATGDVTIKAAGKAVVTATTAETDIYDAGRATYTVTIKDPNQAQYSKISSTDDLVAGDIYIIVNETDRKALGLINASNNGEGVDISVENNVATVDSENSAANPYEITLGGATGAYTLTTAQGSIGITGGTKNTFSTSDNTTWNITFSAQDNAVISNTANNYEIRYNTSMNPHVFRVYAQSSGTSKVQLYKKDRSAPAPSLTIGEEKFATFYSDKAYVMPDGGVTGGIVTDAKDGKLTIDYNYVAGSTVPAKTALLLKGEAGSYPFSYTTSTDEAPTNNLLHGADAVDANGKTFIAGTSVKYYILSHNQAGTDLGFYWAAEDGAPVAYKAPYAFLAIDFGSNPQNAPMMFSLGEEGGTTGITGIETDVNEADYKIYTVTGAYVGKDAKNLPKGVYIVNGRKIVVK